MTWFYVVFLFYFFSIVLENLMQSCVNSCNLKFYCVLHVFGCDSGLEAKLGDFGMWGLLVCYIY